MKKSILKTLAFTLTLVALTSSPSEALAESRFVYVDPFQFDFTLEKTESNFSLLEMKVELICSGYEGYIVGHRPFTSKAVELNIIQDNSDPRLVKYRVTHSQRTRLENPYGFWRYRDRECYSQFVVVIEDPQREARYSNHKLVRTKSTLWFKGASKDLATKIQDTLHEASIKPGYSRRSRENEEPSCYADGTCSWKLFGRIFTDNGELLEKGNQGSFYTDFETNVAPIID
jgi:hypothetical protein